MKKDFTNTMEYTRNFFLGLEKKYNLLEYKLEGLEIWQCIRCSLFDHIISEQNHFHTAHSLITKKDALKFVPKMILNSVFKSPFYTKKNIETIIIENARKITLDINGEMVDIDPYTHYFIEKYPNEYEVFEEMYLFEHQKSLYSTNRFLDLFSLYNFFIGKRKRVTISEDDMLLLNKINDEFKSNLRVDINLIEYIKKNFKRYHSQYSFYKKLFKKIQPKQLYLVCSYSKGGLIKAAKENNIIVKEFQHGFLNSFHLGYHYPYLVDKDSLVTFPDKLLIFGKFWSDITEFPISKENIIMYGYPYLNAQVNKGVFKKKRNKIIFISQGTIGKELSIFFYKVAKELTNYSFIYKIHPGEKLGWKEDYPDLVKATLLDNVEVRENSNIYEDFSESFVQVGVYSTALFEGIAFDCKTILVSMPGIEYMNDLIGTNYVKLVSDVEEFRQALLLSNNNNMSLSKEYFFSQDEISVSD